MHKKIKIEYIILLISWLFWGISQALLWFEQARNPKMFQIITTTSLQTSTCFSFNLLAIWGMNLLRKKIVGRQRQLLGFALIIIVCSFIIVFINTSTFNYLRGAHRIFNKLSTDLVYVTEKIIYLTGFCTMFFLIRNLREYQKQKNIAEEAQQTARDTQLQMLQQQLSPHFLFNTLNSLRSLIAIDTQRAREMVTDLSEFLRVTLSSYKAVHNSIMDEVGLAEYYLKIQKVRFGDDLNYHIHIDQNLTGFTIPKFMLQPLVENAVKYGMKTSPMPLEIFISTTKENGIIKITVTNTGRLIDSNTETHNNNGINNTQARLELMFPGKSELLLKEKDGTVCALISINMS